MAFVFTFIFETIPFVLLRLVLFAAALFFASAVIFALTESLPGNAAEAMLGPSATPETIAALTHQLALDESATARYIAWLSALLHGDAGLSLSYHTPVSALIRERLIVSLPLAGLAFTLTLLLGLSIGLLLSLPALRFGARPNNIRKQIDHGLGKLYCTLGLAIPNFWLGLLLIVLFALKLRWLPAGSFPSTPDFATTLQALILPAFALALGQGAILARLTHSLLREIAGEAYIRTACAKGLGAWRILVHHVLPNSLAPLFALMALQAASLIAGSIVIESVFNLPGLGQLLVQAIANRDSLVIADSLLIMVSLIITLNFLARAVAAWLDPRLARESAKVTL